MADGTSASVDSVFVFGYGSLLWNPGFCFAHKAKGYALGFARRMFQGNIYHHGNHQQINNGYNLVEITIKLADSENSIRAWTCIARLDNEFYLGDANIEQIAGQIREAIGCAGPNFEYVLKLAEQVRMLFPNDNDEHLFELESQVRKLISV